VVPLFAGNLQHPSSKSASLYGHLKTILERCKNHTPTTSMCKHPHAPAHTRPACGCARWRLPPWKTGRAILEDAVVTFGNRIGGIAAPGQHLPGRLGTKPPPSYSRHKARDRTVVSGEVRRGMGKRRLPAISLDPMKFLHAFAAGLRAERPGARIPGGAHATIGWDRNDHRGVA
jgi:hypothetical protein